MLVLTCSSASWPNSINVVLCRLGRCNHVGIIYNEHNFCMHRFKLFTTKYCLFKKSERLKRSASFRREALPNQVPLSIWEIVLSGWPAHSVSHNDIPFTNVSVLAECTNAFHGDTNPNPHRGLASWLGPQWAVLDRGFRARNHNFGATQLPYVNGLLALFLGSSCVATSMITVMSVYCGRGCGCCEH